MEKLKDQWVKNFKNAAIKTSDGSILKGQVNIGEYNRLSDLFKQTHEKFITMIADEADGSKKVYIINKDCIVWTEAEN